MKKSAGKILALAIIATILSCTRLGVDNNKTNNTNTIKTEAVSNDKAADKGTISDNKIIGFWVRSGHHSQFTKYQRKSAFAEDKPGVAFKEGGQFLKRQNSGWCGTPPITYSNDTGTWTRTSDSTVTIRYTYWGGELEEDWLIGELGDKTMHVKSQGQREVGEGAEK